MTTLSYTQDNLPTPQEFQRQLAEAVARSNPLDELLELSAELRDLERAHRMTSPEFFGKYQRGEMGDDEDVIEWAGLYETFLELRRRLELVLMQQAIWSAPLMPAMT
ncbi:MAG: hypothetical protein HY784_10760 [Chloroflexi bacterium]|nr:hypothetical protein [Chloroflexota bacterium]